MDPNFKPKISAQWLVCITAVVLFTIKIIAWYITNSVAVLTDAMESTVNVITGFLGLYSLYLSARPRDENHPYGHGKVEFVSAAVEGTLIVSAGCVIVYESILNFQRPHVLAMLDSGIWLLSVSAVVNFVVGWRAVRQGNRSNTLPLVASGRHLQSDTYTTLGIIAGLVAIRFTHILWLDSVVAIVFAGLIIYMGVKILRSSMAGIMDEQDKKLLEEMVQFLENNRHANWIDLHNLRIIKFGSILHFDCHLTVPWYLTVKQAHEEVDALQNLIKEKYGDSVELFVHTDGCLDFSCTVCTLQNCDVRKAPMVKRITWTVENISKNSRHGVDVLP